MEIVTCEATLGHQPEAQGASLPPLTAATCLPIRPHSSCGLIHQLIHSPESTHLLYLGARQAPL